MFMKWCQYDQSVLIGSNYFFLQGNTFKLVNLNKIKKKYKNETE